MIPDRFHHATSYDGKRLVMLTAEADNNGAPVLALRVFDFGIRGSNVITGTVVPFWVYRDIFVEDCKNEGVTSASRAFARSLSTNGASVGLSHIEDDAFRLLCNVGDTLLRELPENVAKRKKHDRLLKLCAVVYMAGWAALIVLLAVSLR